MATGSRTLKLSILGDVDQLNKSLKAANTDVNNSANQITEFGKKAALAFAVAGAAALAFGADAVKAAVEDEAAQAKLAETIKATTTATAAQIKGVETYIEKTSIAIGVTDDELRPAFARLVRSTKDTEEAQRLLNLALDLAAVTSKPVETVTNALAKAYDGNFTALNKLGVGLDQNLIKSKDNQAIIESLEKTYGRFAEGAAETTAKKFERLKIATNEAKESIGAALLPVVQRLADYLLVTAVPNLESFINGLTGKGSLKEATEDATDSAYKWGVQIKRVLGTVVDFKEELLVVTGVIAGVFVVSKVTAAVQATITLIKSLIVAYNALKASAIVAGVASAFALNPLLGVGAAALAAGVLSAANALANNNNVELPSGAGLGFPSGFKTTEVPSSPIPAPSKISPPTVSGSSSGSAAVAASGKLIMDATANLVPTVTIGGAPAGYTQELFKPTVTIGGAPAGYVSNAVAPQVTVNMGIVGDPEAAARTIVNTVNDAFYRGTGGATAFRIEK
jgi:hypothetical protein